MKNILFILIFLIGVNFTSFAQNRIGTEPGASQTKFIKSYPNPASTVVNFEFQKGYSRSYSIRVLNSIGKQVYESQNMPTLLRIDLREQKFYRGIYIYQLVDKNGLVIESGKILVVN
ncbi:MAG: T9SS type A sorting domain-containing protein [Ferruginibacter sp.]